jgi:hypothetical protein
MALLNGTLVHRDASSWDGYRAVAAWTEPGRDDAPAAARFRSVMVDPKGHFALELPEPALASGSIDLAVNAPSGEAVLRATLDAPASDLAKSFDTASYVPPVTADEDVPAPDTGRNPRLFGRALSHEGTPARAGETAVLWGVPSAPGAERAAYPFLVVAIQPSGYFSGERPTTTFARAYATVGGGPAIPLRLEEGLVPEHVVLVGNVPVGDSPASDCDCAALAPPRLAGHEELTANPESFSGDLGGRCVDLTIPNRALEEVTWSMIVRISEPTVRSITLPEGKPIPPKLLDEIVKFGEASLAAASTGREVVGREAARAVAKPTHVDAREAARVMRVGEPLSLETLLEVDRASRFKTVRELLVADAPTPVRPPMDAKHRADWDDSPTLHQATSIAHGHVLTFRQTWHADGYSLGDLLYSMPLAPGQKKQIATIDWDRRDTVMRLSDREARETLSAMVDRDRDIEDIVRGALDEHVRAGSRATRSSVGGGFGLAIGPVVIGGGGGSAWSSSSAWQTSARDVAGRSLQQVRDRTVQSASSSRSQRTTVVQAVRQGESVRAEATTVANYNHCHAMTIQYFEVLRHFQITHEIVGVQGCLFVPFLLSPFDLEKALRWREPLELSIRRSDLASAFDAAERVRTGWTHAHVPPGAHADEPVQWLDAELYVRIELPRPKDEEDGSFDEDTWAPYEHLLTRTPEEEWKLWLGVVTPAERDRVWALRIAPRIARKLMDELALSVAPASGPAVTIPIDASLVSNRRAGASLLVTLRPSGPLPAITRRQIAAVVLSSSVPVPSPATVVVERGSMRYRTRYLHHTLFADRLIDNDLGTTDDVRIAVPLDSTEKRRPRDEDRRAVAELLAHLNAHLEYYHRNVLLRMHPNRRYLLLDGFEAPNAGGRSIASVVENRVIGVAGNTLIFPLAPGVHLDPSTVIPPDAPGDLLAYYNADAPPPVRVSVPTRGVFAEAILGSCNSCEVKDDTRFWRWEEAPIPDKPADLGAISVASRHQARAALRPDAFSNPLVGHQTPGDLPAPNGFQAALDLLGTPNLFRDLTGVDLNVQHSAQALSSALGTAQFFGGEAAKLAQQRYMAGNTDRVLAAIKDAKEKGLLDEEEAQDLTARALGVSAGVPAEEGTSPANHPAVKKAMNRVASSKSGELSVKNSSGSVAVKTGGGDETYSYTVDPPVAIVAQPSALLCWAAAGAMLLNWRDEVTRTVLEAATLAGTGWREKVDAGEGVTASELRGYARAIGLLEKDASDLTPQRVLAMLRDFGPLWVIHDDYADNNLLVHARIVVGIVGEGDEATLKLLDPASSSPVEEALAELAERMSANDTVRFGVGILHLPKS